MADGIEFDECPGDQDDETNASTTADQINDIDVSGCDLMKCNTCVAGASDDTPFTNPQAIRKWGPFHPWHKYRMRSVTSKAPKSAQCGICVNTFNALGLDLEHGTLGQFFKVWNQPNKREEGPRFVRAVKNFIQQLNKHPDRVKLKDKSELKAAFTIVSTLNNMGHQDSGPTKRFFQLENWDEAEDGKLDMSKVVDEFVCGQNRRGCWVVQGREGVYFRKPIEELSDGRGPFADEREKKIRETYTKALEDKSKKV